MTTGAKRFKITWRDGAYYVSIPNYEGGEVVDAAIHDRDQETIRELLACLKGLASDENLADQKRFDGFYTRAQIAISRAEEAIHENQ